MAERRKMAEEVARHEAMQRELEASRVEQLAWKAAQRAEAEAAEAAEVQRIRAVKARQEEQEHEAVRTLAGWGCKGFQGVGLSVPWGLSMGAAAWYPPACIAWSAKQLTEAQAFERPPPPCCLALLAGDCTPGGAAAAPAAPAEADG